MELWLVFTLTGYSIFAIAATLDKYMMNQRYHPVTTVLLRTFFNGLFLGTAGLLFLHLSITPAMLLLSLIPAALLVVSFVVYLWVLQRKNASEIQPFSQSLDALFIFLAAIALLHEVARPENYVGIVVIVVGIYLVLAKHITKIPHLDRHLVFIAALVPIDVAYALLVKLFLSDVEPIPLATSIYLLSALLLALVSLFMRRRELFTSNALKQQLRIVIPASLCAATGAGFTYTALSLANASKVYPMAGIDSVMVFLFATVFLKERFHKHRLIGTLIVFLGIYLISLS
jgi:uncharacterized membrane protein